MCMTRKFLLSLEDIPRQKSFCCLSLKIGTVVSALAVILFTVLSLAQCFTNIERLIPGAFTISNTENIVMYCVAIGVMIFLCITLVLTAIMLVGTLTDKVHLMRPWVVWTSYEVLLSLLLLVYGLAVNMALHQVDRDLILVYIVSFVGLMVRFYFLTLVASHYRQLVEESAGRLKSLYGNDNYYSAV